jgi:uncharacterized protein
VRAIATLFSLMCVWTIAGCASHEQEHFYTVSAADEGGAASATASDATGRPLVRVARLALPELINRPQLVLRAGEHEVRILEGERWAGPLADDLTRELLAALRRADSGADYVAADAPRSEDAVRQIDAQIDALDASPGGAIHLRANWVLRDRARKPLARGRIDRTLQAPGGGDAATVVQGYGLAMRALAEAIVAQPG